MNLSLKLTNKWFSKRAYFRGRAYNKVFTVFVKKNLSLVKPSLAKEDFFCLPELFPVPFYFMIKVEPGKSFQVVLYLTTFD